MNFNDNFLTNDLILASVLGFVIGDALGVPLEFKDRQELKENIVTDMLEFGTHNQPLGTWSDDTSMVLATIDSLIACESINYKDIMNKYNDWYRQAKYTANGEVFDIGFGTRRALDRFNDGYKLEDCGLSSFTNNGNGALMRMLPIALWTFNEKLPYRKEIEIVYYYSSLTHGHNISMMGCKIYSDFIREILLGNSPQIALQNLSGYNYDDYYDDYFLYKRIFDGSLLKIDEKDINSSGYVIDTLEAAIWCILHSYDFESAVLKAINLGGDTDTIAAITGSLAGLIYGYNNIPQKWLSKIRKKDLIVELSEKFESLLKKKSVDLNENRNL